MLSSNVIIFRRLMFGFVILISTMLQPYAFSAEQIKAIATIPDLAEVIQRIGGKHVVVESLLDGSEDSHFLDALPSFVKKVADVDLVCIVGLDLEIGWIPKILSRSGNARVQSGGAGYCEVGKSITVLEKPEGKVNRSMGDVHAFGNPHFNLSPNAMIEAGLAIFGVLKSLRPEFTQDFETGYKKFSDDMSKLFSEVKQKFAKYEKRNKVIEYHREFSYFFSAYGISSIGAIEDKPGVPPSAARLAQIAEKAKQEKVGLAFGALYSPEKHLQRFAELSGIAFRRVPTMVQKNKADFDSIEKLQHALANSILGK